MSVFPTFKGMLDYPEHNCPNEYRPVGGLTKRDLFAVMILQVAIQAKDEAFSITDLEGACKDSVMVADKLIAELAKGEG